MIARHQTHTYVLVLSSLALSSLALPSLAALYLFGYLRLLENDQKKRVFASAIYSRLGVYMQILIWVAESKRNAPKVCIFFAVAKVQPWSSELGGNCHYGKKCEFWDYMRCFYGFF